MKRGHWTFLYVPSKQGGVRTLHVSKRMVGIAAGAVAFVGLVALLFSLGIVRQGVAVYDSHRLRQENRALQTRLATLESKLGGFQDQIQRNFELLDRANLVAGLTPLDSVTQQVGVGGYELPVDTTLSAMSPLTRERVVGLQENLEKLVRQARLQRQGYEKVLFALQESQYLRDCTPSIRPVVRGFLTSGFGRRIDPFTGQPALHTGIDFSAPMGTPVRATANGTVVRAAWWGTLGKVVEVDHGNGLSTRYGHLSAFHVQKGDVVQRGDLLGAVGSSGRSTAPHLHYEVVRQGQPENPWAYLIPE